MHSNLRLFERQGFTLFLSVILHPDSFQLWPSQTSLRSVTAAFSKATRSNFLKMQRAFWPLSVVWLHLGPPLFLKHFSAAHLELCSAPLGKEYIYGKCKSKYLSEFICNNRTGKLFKNNNNNNKETSQEIIEWLIPLAGLIYFYANRFEMNCTYYFQHGSTEGPCSRIGLPLTWLGFILKTEASFL